LRGQPVLWITNATSLLAIGIHVWVWPWGSEDGVLVMDRTPVAAKCSPTDLVRTVPDQ
jgi:hypothetical protein